MAYKSLPLSSLVVNPANDRHGELENETAAIANLFASHEAHMKRLAKDLVETKEILEPPLVCPRGDKYIVADGNRRTTCLKLIVSPRRAPTTELQRFFSELQESWEGDLPNLIQCRVEIDRDRIDEILYRRHTGVQGGIGQAKWTDRMKNNFVVRTGKKSGINTAEEIEKLLISSSQLPGRKIPRSNLNRLLSSEALRNRVGISTRAGKLEIIRDEKDTITALNKIASDLAHQHVTLDDIWDTQSKLSYLDKLDSAGILPTLSPKAARVDASVEKASAAGAKGFGEARAIRGAPWPHLIPDLDHKIIWTANLQRHKEIWEELQFDLDISSHKNAISVLFRVLIELAVENYINVRALADVHENDKLARKVSKISNDMLQRGIIDKKYAREMEKMNQSEQIVSMDTLHRYVHSPNFSVSSEHLKTIWATVSRFIVCCLTAEKA